MNGWDIALIVAVSVMGTAVARIRNPEYKAFVVMLPIPFTLATLAVGRPLDATNVLAVGLLFCFSLGVWTLHARLRWPILAAIITCAVGYCIIGAGIASIKPTSDWAFWTAWVSMLALSVTLIRVLPYRREPHHRTPLPTIIKLPAIAAVVCLIVAIKQQLGGFMTMFPMVGVIAAYEARNSLWTIVRRIPWVMAIMTPAMGVIRLTQAHAGLPRALALAWLLILCLFWALRRGYHTSVPAVPGLVTATAPDDLP